MKLPELGVHYPITTLMVFLAVFVLGAVAVSAATAAMLRVLLNFGV